MPPHKQPKSFRDIALDCVANLVVNCTVNIEKTFGYYDVLECREAVNSLQAELLTLVPTNLWDRVCQAVLIRVFQTPMTLNIHDVRIIYATLIHERVKILEIRLSLGFPFCHDHIQFWKDHIAKLTNIRELNLHNFVCNDILFAISQECCNLENVILSPYVSSAVLDSFINCTKLRSIRSAVSFRFEGSMLNIVNSLLELEYCEYDSMAEILTRQTIDRELRLQYIKEVKATPRSIASVIQFCPHLQHLDLKPLSNDDCCAIFIQLATSSLQVSTFVLRSYFPFNKSMKHFLSVKGSFITTLKLIDCTNIINFKAVNFIGDSCRNLTTLVISVIGEPILDVSPQPLIDSESSSPEPTPDLLFKKLAVLILEDVFGDRYWDPKIALMCLANAPSITSITLSGMIDVQPTEKTFFEVFSAERMMELRHLDLRGNLLLSESMLCYLYKSCCNLTKLAIWCKLDAPAASYLKVIIKEVEENNLDLVIDFRV